MYQMFKSMLREDLRVICKNKSRNKIIMRNMRSKEKRETKTQNYSLLTIHN